MTDHYGRALYALSKTDGGIINIDPVAASIDNAGLRAFVNAVEAVESIRRNEETDSKNFAMADNYLLTGTDWGHVSYVPERDSYNLRYRGVCWESSAAVVVAAADEVKAFLEDIGN